MQRFLIFIHKIQFFILFVLLELAAIGYFSKSSIYTNAKIMNASNKLVGGVYNSIYDIKSYFILRDENRRLIEHVAELQNRLDVYKSQRPDINIDSMMLMGDSTNNMYQYSNARVINNSIVRRHNTILIDRGLRDGMERDMALICEGNIVGYILDCSENFSVAMSVLNTSFKTSGRCDTKDYNGSIRWDGVFYDRLTMIEIPKYAKIEVGDTITTTTFSSRFPAGLGIGVISKVELINGTYYNAYIKPFINYDRLQYVNVVKYKDIKERMLLENEVEVQQEESDRFNIPSLYD